MIMTLIVSISGIRGTIGGEPGKGLTPPDILRFVTAYCRMLRMQHPDGRVKVVVGRDGRKSGPAINRMVCGVLQLCGVDVVDLGLSTTPSVELAVTWHKAQGGIILTASHNGAEWNALKLLDHKGEFISEAAGRELLLLTEKGMETYPDEGSKGHYTTDYQSIERHVEAILQHPLVDIEAIRGAQLSVAFDGINSSGGIALPLLLKELGVNNVFPLNDQPDGQFAHNPEPLPEHLGQLRDLVKKKKADVGFAVDPDVDRLAIVCGDGSFFGEENTLVAVADYVLSVTPGNTVSNLSSSRALRDVTNRYGQQYYASAVGEVHVVEMMKQVEAVIGGEGNGGVILPSLHYGRDALAGVALFLTALAKRGGTLQEWKQSLPEYHIKKNKVDVGTVDDIEGLFDAVADRYPEAETSRLDGLKLDFHEGWVHLRKSNTEPIIRIYSESCSAEGAEALAAEVMEVMKSYVEA